MNVIFAIIMYAIGFLLMAVYRNKSTRPSARFVGALLWPMIVPPAIIALGILGFVDLVRRK